MKVSRSKTEYLCVNGGNDEEAVKMEETKVPRVKKFKYLGSTVEESDSCEWEVKRRVQAGWNKWRKVSGVICNRRLPARVKEKVYSSVVRPAMVYGFEMVAVTKKQVEEIIVTEMKILKFAMGVMRKDKIQNEYIRGTAKVEWLGMKMREGRLRWYGEHTMRRDQEYLERRVMEMELPGEEKEAKEKISGCNNGGYGKVCVREKDIRNRMLWRSIICCGNFLLKKKKKKNTF